MDGFHAATELAKGEIEPVIVMTGHGEVPVAVRAMKLGDRLHREALSEEAPLASFGNAFLLLDEREATGKRRRAARDRVTQLTARETDVLRGLLAGESNKQLAQRLGISLRTVEMHRGNMMERLEVASLAEALKLALEASLEPAPDPDL